MIVWCLFAPIGGSAIVVLKFSLPDMDLKLFTDIQRGSSRSDKCILRVSNMTVVGLVLTV